jgi:hypothetical protein
MTPGWDHGRPRRLAERRAEPERVTDDAGNHMRAGDETLRGKSPSRSRTPVP